MNNNQRYTIYAFTLVELSIVLVIIGLVIGGVLVGKDMIEQGTIRKVVNELNTYKTTMWTFYNKYDCLPGDCADATQFFPSAGTADGNGDGSVEHSNESRYSWQQVGEAGLTKGYNVIPVGGSGQVIPGDNVPESAVDGAGYWFRDRATSYFSSLVTPGNSFLLAKEDTFFAGPFFSTFDARSIDIKLDDGIANSGQTIAQNGQVSAVQQNCLSVEEYDLSQSGLQCIMIFIFQ